MLVLCKVFNRNYPFVHRRCLVDGLLQSFGILGLEHLWAFQFWFIHLCLRVFLTPLQAIHVFVASEKHVQCTSSSPTGDRPNSLLAASSAQFQGRCDRQVLRVTMWVTELSLVPALKGWEPVSVTKFKWASWSVNQSDLDKGDLPLFTPFESQLGNF